MRMNTVRARSAQRLLLSSAAAAVAVSMFGMSAHAANAYWDPTNGPGAGTGGINLNGNWNTTEAKWNSLADGTGTSNPWVNGDTAVFAAGNDSAGTTYVVTTTAALSLAGITMEEGTKVTV